ncbi:MAG TPA: YggT family protein [Bacillota bacterium]|nr:YggT family protein [Bacillota bacterium]
MTDIKQTVTRTEEQGVAPTGASVQQQTKRVQTQSALDPKITMENIVWYILGIIEILLAFRFVLKILGANSASHFVSFTYGLTNPITAPFDSMFGVVRPAPGITGSVFEPSILVAAAVYCLVAWGIVKLLGINQRD